MKLKQLLTILNEVLESEGEFRNTPVRIKIKNSEGNDCFIQFDDENIIQDENGVVIFDLTSVKMH